MAAVASLVSMQFSECEQTLAHNVCHLVRLLAATHLTQRTLPLRKQVMQGKSS